MKRFDDHVSDKKAPFSSDQQCNQGYKPIAQASQEFVMMNLWHMKKTSSLKDSILLGSYISVTMFNNENVKI